MYIRKMNNFVYFNSFTYHTIKFLQINFKYQAYFFTVLLYIIMFIIIYVCLCATSLRSHRILCGPLDGLQPTRFLCPWDFSDKITEVGFHALLQGIFPNQGLNPGLLYCRQILYHLSHQGSNECYVREKRIMNHILWYNFIKQVITISIIHSQGNGQAMF